MSNITEQIEKLAEDAAIKAAFQSDERIKALESKVEKLSALHTVFGPPPIDEEKDLAEIEHYFKSASKGKVSDEVKNKLSDVPDIHVGENPKVRSAEKIKQRVLTAYYAGFNQAHYSHVHPESFEVKECQSAGEEYLLKNEKWIDADLKEYALVNERKDIPEWYTVQEIYNWLRHENYDEKIAKELAEKWAKSNQSAFAKGWEKATNDKSGTFDYKYFNERKDNIEIPDIEKLIEKFLPNQFDLASFKPKEVELLKSSFQQGATVMFNELKNTSQNERKDNVGVSDAIEFQQRVYEWLLVCFGEEISNDKIERNHRFLEESIELVQSIGCTKSEAHQLVDYVFGRPIGEPKQEVGGVIVTLAALCSASKINLVKCGETELARIWTKVDKIREKQANKPKHSTLPESQPQQKEVDEELVN